MPAFVPTRPGTGPTASSANPATNLAPVLASISRTGRYYLLAIDPWFLFVRHECTSRVWEREVAARRKSSLGGESRRTGGRQSLGWNERTHRSDTRRVRPRPPGESWGGAANHCSGALSIQECKLSRSAVQWAERHRARIFCWRATAAARRRSARDGFITLASTRRVHTRPKRVRPGNPFNQAARTVAPLSPLPLAARKAR